MDKVFPSELKAIAKNPKFKKIFISDVKPTGANDCKNCGGVEIFALFLALKGPFQSPGAPGAKEGDHYLTSHWDSTAGKTGGWWVGYTMTFSCPVCIKGQIQKPLMDYPVQREIGRLIHPDTREVLE